MTEGATSEVDPAKACISGVDCGDDTGALDAPSFRGSSETPGVWTPSTGAGGRSVVPGKEEIIGGMESDECRGETKAPTETLWHR